VRSLMRTVRSTQYVGLLLVPLMVLVLWGSTPLPALLAWSVYAVAVAFWRVRAWDELARELARHDLVDPLALFNRRAWLWPLAASVWGLLALLHFNRAPLADEFIGWLVAAGLAMFGMNSLSAHLRTMHLYLNTLAGLSLAVVLGHLAVAAPGPAWVQHLWLALLLVLFWALLLQAGRRLHRTLRRNFELQYRNQQLIESLTRQTQAALDAVEIKNRFLASAAHDLRQPVHALGLYADWLRGEPELAHEIAPKIVESTKAVNALFDSLFDLARLDSGKIKLNIEPIALEQLLHDLELRYRPLAEAKGLQLRMHVVPGTVISDPILLQRIVGNLISNAIKYTERGGVLVAARVTPSGRRIEVWDTGVGIAPHHRREIFREFYKVPAHPGTEDGFGLGLYIVARLSNILGHPLTLRSRVGRGTMFRLMLRPTDPQAAAMRAAASVAQLASSPWIRA